MLITIDKFKEINHLYVWNIVIPKKNYERGIKFGLKAKPLFIRYT